MLKFVKCCYVIFYISLFKNSLQIILKFYSREVWLPFGLGRRSSVFVVLALPTWGIVSHFAFYVLFYLLTNKTIPMYAKPSLSFHPFKITFSMKYCSFLCIVP